jgi:hypothetical protein
VRSAWRALLIALGAGLGLLGYGFAARNGGEVPLNLAVRGYLAPVWAVVLGAMGLGVALASLIFLYFAVAQLRRERQLRGAISRLEGEVRALRNAPLRAKELEDAPAPRSPA